MDSEDEDSVDKQDAGEPAEEEEELLERSLQGLEKLDSFGRVMLALPALTQWLKSGSINCEEVVGTYQVFKRVKFFDADVFRELSALLRDLLEKGSLNSEQAHEVIICMHSLNAYDQQVFSAVARAFKGKIDEIDPYILKTWSEVYAACGHKADASFCELLRMKSKSSGRRQCSADAEEHSALMPQGVTALGGEALFKVNGIPRYWPSLNSKQRFDWDDTSWMSGDQKDSYVKRVKAFKKRGLPFVQAWYNFCKYTEFEHRDPGWHTVESMNLFLSEMAAMERDLSAGTSHETFNSRLEKAFNGGIPPSDSSSSANFSKPTDPALVEFIAKWKLHLEAQRLLTSLPDFVMKRVIAEFSPKDTSRDVNGLFMKFARGKQEYLELRESDGKAM